MLILSKEELTYVSHVLYNLFDIGLKSCLYYHVCCVGIEESQVNLPNNPHAISQTSSCPPSPQLHAASPPSSMANILSSLSSTVVAPGSLTNTNGPQNSVAQAHVRNNNPSSIPRYDFVKSFKLTHFYRKPPNRASVKHGSLQYGKPQMHQVGRKKMFCD